MEKLTLVFLVAQLYFIGLDSCGIDSPKFSSSYSVSGTLYIPYAELREPFAAWFDTKSGSSRIDYYGGMVKTYQLTQTGEYGQFLKVAPVTTETQMNVQTCLQLNGTKEMKVKPQSVLPDLTGFECLGVEYVNGMKTEKWRLVNKTFPDKVSKYSMYIYWKKSSKSPRVAIAVPVRYEMIGYNSLLGSHYDHYYINYEMFSWDAPDPEVFTVGQNMTCQDYPTPPGVRHVFTFNPMEEFIHNRDDHVEDAWESYIRTHQKNYTDQENVSRKDVFRQNMRLIHSTNRANLGFQLAVNHLADRTKDELKILRGRKVTIGYNGGQPYPYNADEMVKDLPDQLDWRLFGAVTHVKDQSVCGSCWSFGTTGTIEGAYFVKYGHLVYLSQQALIDCSWGFGNNGCDGGEDAQAYQWIMKHGGIPTEGDYGPYYGQDGYCHTDKVPLTAKITSFVNVTSGDQNALKVALAKHGPISVAIDASVPTFTFYANGIYYDPKCGNKPENLDHAVLLVGYGQLNGKDYWLVKNSWSNYWGNDGYILMSPSDNNCGVMTSPTYVNF